MKKKINLKKEDVIVFLGSMNAMPMMYALELKKLGYEVIYFIDTKESDILSRPENHYPSINYPYPSWIVENTLLSQILLPIFPRLFSAIYSWRIKKITKKTVGCFVLNGFFTSLAPYLSKNINKIGLSHGSDLDVWADIDNVKVLSKKMATRSIFKYLPTSVCKYLINHIVNMQYIGYKSVTVVVYFPIGLNSMGDKVIDRLINIGAWYIPRYDISFEPLSRASRDFKPASKTIQIFSGVRFLFKTFPEGNTGYNKGNDLIIKGIANYFIVNKNIQVHFIEKGEDIIYAKVLCKQLGLDKVVVWHKEMPFKKLLDIYQESDICFDQLGEHWIGAIGGYALWLGKPLIANSESVVRAGIWPSNNPICSAINPKDVFDWLVKLENNTLREKISIDSKEFVEIHMGPNKVLNLIFKF